MGPRHILSLLLLAASASAFAIEPFTEEALTRGLNYTMGSYPQTQGVTGNGVGFADLDNDGDPDVIALGKAAGSVGIFENLGNGTFVDRSATSGIPAMPEMQAFAAADYDADGKIDIYITQYLVSNRLLRNLGNFTFSNVTTSSGTGAGVLAHTGAAWGDYDNDGDLDIHVSNYAQDKQLFRNNGNGTFLDQAAILGIQAPAAMTFMGIWTDYDRDGDVDLYISNDRGAQPPAGTNPPNMLWENVNGTLLDVSAASGADVGLFSMGIGAGDIDNNAYTDLYCTDIFAWDATGHEVQYDGMNPLLLNQGNKTYVTTYTAGVENQISSWSANFFDFDNDSFTDVYVVNQFEPNNLFRNPAGLPCVEMPASVGLEGTYDTDYSLFSDPPDYPTIAKYSSAIADVDGDGDIDVIQNPAGHRLELFINHEGELRNHVRYDIVGIHPNLNAIGAGVETTAGGRTRLHEVFAGGNGYLGQNELTVHVGLGNLTSVTRTEVRWPPTGPTGPPNGPERILVGLPVNNRWKIYPPNRLCDADGDGIDYADFEYFGGCFESGFTQGCEMMDFTGNSVINVVDLDECFISSPADCNGNGTEDLIEIAMDISIDANDNYVIDCCTGSTTEPNPVGATLLLGKSGGTVAELGWTAPPVDGSHAAATSYDVFRSPGALSFAPHAGVTSASYPDPAIPAAGTFYGYLIGARNSCGSSGEEPF